MEAAAAPAPPKSVVLRPYQAKAVNAVIGGFESGKRAQLVVQATGTGKTYTFGTVARWMIEDRGGRVLVIAHREELIEQAAAALEDLGITTVVEKAEHDARRTASLFPDVRCVVGSVPTRP